MKFEDDLKLVREIIQNKSLPPEMAGLMTVLLRSFYQGDEQVIRNFFTSSAEALKYLNDSVDAELIIRARKALCALIPALEQSLRCKVTNLEDEIL